MSFRQAVVLIVEDEPLIRMFAASVFEDAGYIVLEASSADEAIAILERRGDVQLIFTDINMPGSMDGLKLAWAVRDRWPPVKILITSGMVRLTPEHMPAGGYFIPKPYTKFEVAKALAQIAK